MKKINSLIIYIIAIIIILILFVGVKNTKDNLENKSNQIEFLEKNLINKKAQILNMHTELLKKNINIENIIFENGILFFKNQEQNFKLKNNSTEYSLNILKSNDLIFAKHPEASSSAYVDFYNKNIFLTTATGQIAYSNIKNINNNDIIFKTIKSNIQEIIKYPEFYTDSQFGVKDILLNNNKIYISYVNQHYEGCFSTSILEGDIQYSYIKFEKFYTPDKCVDKNNEYFSIPKNKLIAHQSGGRMIIKDNLMFFSTGEYRHRTLAQEDDNDFGKILSIQLHDKTKKILSKGHRNPQGLFLNEDLNILFSTEHGPSGGDEINYLKLDELNSSNVSNYGWPMSSYGRHYHDDNDDNDERYKLAPLKKSHSKYGYVEPLKYFDPSVGISQIISIPKKFSGVDNYKFIVGTMGNAKKFKEGMLSLYFFEFNKGNEEIVNSEIIPIKSRVRDMVYVKEENIVLMFLENYNSLAILRKK